MQKFSDCSPIVGSIKDGQEGDYRTIVEDFVGWCRNIQLQLNTTKTKEMVVDLESSASPLLPVTINRVNVETVSTYKIQDNFYYISLYCYKRVKLLCILLLNKSILF